MAMTELVYTYATMQVAPVVYIWQPQNLSIGTETESGSTGGGAQLRQWSTA